MFLKIVRTKYLSKLLRFLLKLKPNDLKFAIRLITESRAGLCAFKKLADVPADLPEVQRRMRTLEKAGMIETNEETGELMAILAKPLKNFADHVNSFTEELDLTLAEADLSEANPAKAKMSKRGEMLEIISEYSKLQGNFIEIDTDYIKRHCRAAIKLLEKAKTTEKAKEIMTAVKTKMEFAGLDWSLQGAVLNHADKILRSLSKDKPGWDW